MSYQKNWVASPNFTPASQTQAAYGRPRQIQGGAGHWWNWPRSGATHDGIVSYMANPSRQAAPHAVLSAGRVTEMVRDQDTAWCTSNANPYTFAIEIDPRIMFRWGYDNPSAAEKALGNQIFETLCEYIADKGYHNLPWKPHNVWAPGTQCNPIPYDDVMRRAKEYRAAKDTPVVPEWQKNLKDIQPIKLMVLPAQTPIVNLNNLQVIKQLGQGTWIDFTKSTTVNGVEYLISSYSATQAMPNGIKRADVGVPAEPPVNEKPEWLKNLEDIADVMMYARADTDLVNFEDGSTIKVIPRGTEIEIGSVTELHGVNYAITRYSTEKKFPQGIRIDDLDLKPIENPDEPVEPAPEQPEITPIEDNINWLVKAVKAILAFFGIKV